MYPDLQGKVAVVTGASKGIGRAIAERFGNEKMRVVVNYNRDREQALKVVEEIEASGGEGAAIFADVSREDYVRELIAGTVQTFGRLDVLVNNAGIQTTKPSHKLSLEEWHKVMDINLTGAFVCCRESILYMLEGGVKGTIINISSVHQAIPKPFHVHYAASKGGMKLLTESLALEYAGVGIRINAIAPGAIATPMNAQILDDPAQTEDLLKLIPLKQIGKAEQIASAAAWLASKEADYVTGITLFVDGGMTL